MYVLAILLQSNTPIEEAALSETHPVIIYNTQQAWLVVDGQVILEPTKAEAPECLVAAYYVFNIKYKPNLKHVFAFLEKTVFGKYITTPGQVTSRLYQVLSTTK